MISHYYNLLIINIGNLWLLKTVELTRQEFFMLKNTVEQLDTFTKLFVKIKLCCKILICNKYFLLHFLKAQPLLTRLAIFQSKAPSGCSRPSCQIMPL